MCRCGGETRTGDCSRHLGRLGSVATTLVALLVTVPGSVAAHGWGTRTEAEQILAGVQVNESADPLPLSPPGRRVAAAGSSADAGLLPGVSGPLEWALFTLVALLSVAAAFGLLVVIAKLVYGLVTGTAGWLSRVASALSLSEGQVRVAVVAMLALGAIMFVGLEVQENTTSLWDSEEGPAGRANDFKEQGLKGDPVGSLSADAILTGDSYTGAPYDRPSPDTDGDRLKDSWEKRGMTPGGARLPGADPNHKDLYVQINYGANVSAYTDAEKAALRRSWARMPVDNPDGTPGITLHLREGRRLPTTPTFDSTEGSDIHRFYTRGYMGPRQCVYHQVVIGRVALGNTVGLAGSPGYTAAVEADRVQFNESNTTRRVHVTNHELLHNVVGQLPSGGIHTSQGWLVPAVSPEQDYLSPAAETVLDEQIVGSGYFQHEVCGGTATASG